MTESAKVAVVTSEDRSENEIEREFSPVHVVPGNRLAVKNTRREDHEIPEHL
jgi:hypothetical protein